MVDSKIVKYIKDTISAGYAETDIKNALIKQGWSAQDVDEAMSIARTEMQKAQPEPQKQAPQPLQPKEEPKIAVKQGAQKPASVEESKQLPESGISGGIILAIIGGALIIINSVLVLLQTGDILGLFVSNIDLSLIAMMGTELAAWDLFLIDVIIGAFVICASIIILMMKEKARITGLFMIVLSAIAVLIGNGFMIGGIVSIAGGVLVFLGR